jgi:hypothetical protein
LASDPAQQDGVDGEQAEHGRADGDKDEIHEDKAPVFWSRWSMPYRHQGSPRVTGRPHKRSIKAAPQSGVCVAHRADSD